MLLKGDSASSSMAEAKGGGSTESPVQMQEVTRASMVIPLEPWRIAEDPEKHKKGKCREEKKKKKTKKQQSEEKKCSACELINALYETQRATASVYNFITRSLWRQDADFLDAFMVRHGRKPLSKEWDKPNVYYYAEARAAHPDMASGIVATIQKKASGKWILSRWKALVTQEESPPHYRDTQPIPLRKQDYALVESEERDTFELAFTLHSGRRAQKGKEYIIPLRTKDQKQYNCLRKIARGEWKGGEVALLRERKDRGKGGGPVNKWFVRISYKKQVEVTTEPNYAALNRGIAFFLVGYTSTGQKYILDGNDIRSHLRALQNRRRDRQRGYKHAGRNRKGHGRKRALQPIAHLYKKGEMWRQTYNQTKARNFAKWCKKNEVDRVYLADFSNIRNDYVDKLEGGKRLWDLIQEWPYYNLQMRLVSCLEEEGIEVYQMPAQNITRTCPRCGNVKEEAVISRQYKCETCGYERHRDIVACQNELARGERLRREGELEQISFGESKGKKKKDLGKKPKK